MYKTGFNIQGFAVSTDYGTVLGYICICTSKWLFIYCKV